MFLPSKNKRKKKNIPADARHFLNTTIDSTDFKNEHLTTKIGRNKEEKPYFKKKISQKMFTYTEQSKKKSTSSNIRQRNNSNKRAKNCWLCTYRRSRSNKINYMFVPPKNKAKEQSTN